MTTLVLGPRPPELQALIDRRRKLGQDGHDEVWDGVYVMAPFARTHHGALKGRIIRRIDPLADAAGLVAGDSFNIGRKDDFRVPDAGWHRELPDAVYVPTAALVLEVLSPDDRTFEKFDFYAAHGVQELLVADSDRRTLRCWRLIDGRYVEHPRSALLDIAITELIAGLHWP